MVPFILERNERCVRYSEYRYAVVNDRRVIVEPRTRKIIKIID